MSLFFGKTVRPQNGLLIFLGKFRNKIMEIVEDFACESIFSFLFLFLIIFLHFFNFFIFSFFKNCLFFFCFFHFFNFSFFFHFLSVSFSFFLFVGCSKSDFFGEPISLRFLLTVFM